jgi:hypothetical protein
MGYSAPTSLLIPIPAANAAAIFSTPSGQASQQLLNGVNFNATSGTTPLDLHSLLSGSSAAASSPFGPGASLSKDEQLNHLKRQQLAQSTASFTSLEADRAMFSVDDTESTIANARATASARKAAVVDPVTGSVNIRRLDNWFLRQHLSDTGHKPFDPKIGTSSTPLPNPRTDLTGEVQQKATELHLPHLAAPETHIQAILCHRWQHLVPPHFFVPSTNPLQPQSSSFWAGNQSESSTKFVSAHPAEFTNSLTMNKYLTNACKLNSVFEDPVATSAAWGTLKGFAGEAEKYRWSFDEARDLTAAAISDFANAIKLWCTKSDDSKPPVLGALGPNMRNCIRTAQFAAQGRDAFYSDPAFTGIFNPKRPLSGVGATQPRLPGSSNPMIPPWITNRPGSPAMPPPPRPLVPPFQAPGLPFQTPPPGSTRPPASFRNRLLAHQYHVRRQHVCESFQRNVSCRQGAACQLLCYGTMNNQEWSTGGQALARAL